MNLFKYTGQTGQKVGFGLVETGQVYSVTNEAAPILEADQDFTKLTGKAATKAESSAVPAWPEAASAPPAVVTDDAAPEATPVAADLDHAIITFTAPAPAKDRRSTAKK